MLGSVSILFLVKFVALFGAIETQPLNALGVDLHAKAFEFFLGTLPFRRAFRASRIALTIGEAVQFYARVLADLTSGFQHRSLWPA
jgi:hypothetical protein